MFKRIEKEVRFYVRKSKTGKTHPYKRIRSYAVFECDECHEEFQREKGKVDHKRFAQRKGVEQRKKLNMPAGLDIPISDL